MKILYFSLKNIRRNPAKSTAVCIAVTLLMLLVLTFVFVAFGVNSAMQEITDGRKSENAVYYDSTDISLEDCGIDEDAYYENVRIKTDNFAGNMIIEDIGEIYVMTQIYSTADGGVPQVFEDEYAYMGGNSLYLYGGPAVESGQIVISADVFEGNNFKDLQRLIGKKITLYNNFSDSCICVVENAVLTGIIDDKIKDIAWLENSRVGVCFMQYDGTDGSNVIFLPSRNAENVLKKLDGAGIKAGLISSTPLALQKVEKLSEFTLNVLILTVVVFLVAYVMFQTLIIRNEFAQKADYLFTMRALGFTDSKLMSILIAETALLSLIALAVALAAGLIVFRLISYVFTLMFSVEMTLSAAAFFIGVVGCFILVLLLFAINALIAVVSEHKSNY